MHQQLEIFPQPNGDGTPVQLTLDLLYKTPSMHRALDQFPHAIPAVAQVDAKLPISPPGIPNAYGDMPGATSASALHFAVHEAWNALARLELILAHQPR